MDDAVPKFDTPVLAENEIPGDNVSIPENVDAGQSPEAHPPITNLAADLELVKKVLSRAKAKYNQYKDDRSDLEEQWKDADYRWKCGQNTATVSAKTNKNDTNDESSTHAKTGATALYRQITRITAQVASYLQMGKEPFRYIPIYSTGAFIKAEEGVELAGQYNDLARWTMKEDQWETKLVEMLTQLNKYGNLPVFLRWKYRTAKRIVKIPVRGAPLTPDGIPPVIGYTFSETNAVVENYPSIEFIPNENFYADRHIGSIAKQNCIVIRSVDVNYSDLYAGQRDGYYLGVEKLTAAQLYKGEVDTDAHGNKQENVGLSVGDDTQTGCFEQYDVLLKVPIGDDGKWDDKNNEPVIYWATFVGALDGDPVCVRLQRNPDPDDEYAILMWHQFPDDPDNLYHVSAAQIAGSTYDELTTAKNQAIDNRTLQNRKPLKVVKGEVYNTDLKMGQDKVYYLEKQDSIGEFQIADITGTIMANVQYLESDLDRALSTTGAIEGLPMGQRTSASEYTGASAQAKMPHMLNSRYQLGQLLPWYAKKMARYWQLYALEDQVVELTHEPFRREIKPATLYGDYEVDVSVIDEVSNDQQRLQALNFAITALLPNPIFAKSIDPDQFLRDWTELNMWRNPKWIRPLPQEDAKRIARLENMAMLDPRQPVYDEPQPGEDHPAHLSEHEPFLAQFDNIENADQLYPGLPFLRQHVAATKMLQAQQPGGFVPSPAQPMNATPGQAVGNMQSAMMGAMEPQPTGAM